MDIKKKIGIAMRTQTVGLNVISKFLTPLNFTLISLTFLKTYKVSIPMHLMIVMFLAIFCTVFMVGYVYDRLGFYRTELSFDGKRNIMFQKILDKMDEKK